MKKMIQTGIDKDIFDLIWNNTNDAIFTIAKDGAIHRANPSFEMMSGYTTEKLRGISYPPYLIEPTPEEHPSFIKALQSGQDFPYVPKKIKSKEGEKLDVLASYRAVDNEEIIAVGMYKDFTEQRLIQSKIEEQEHLYRMLVEHLPDAVLKVQDGRIEYINQAGLELLDKEQIEEVVGAQITQFLTNDDSECIEQILRTIYTRKNWEKPITIEDTLYIHTGKEVYAEVKMIPIGTKEKPDIQFIIRDITEKKQYEAKLEYMAYHDPLTGLKNRRLFTDFVADSLNEAKEKNEKIAILYIDIDEFKQVNDTYGHDVGDQLLQQFATRLQNLVREEDVLSRVGGDEFLVLLKGIKSEEHIHKIIQRMHKAGQDPYEINGKEMNITSSVGISLFPENGLKGKTLIYYADQALYRAKKQKNRYIFYE